MKRYELEDTGTPCEPYNMMVEYPDGEWIKYEDAKGIIENRCTCDEHHWDSHPCPYQQEINGNDDGCNCCPYCEQQCADDI